MAIFHRNTTKEVHRLVNQTPRLVVVSNRLPVVLEGSPGKWSIHPGSGGLVTALSPILRDRGGLWIGWVGTSDQIDIPGIKTVLGPASEASGYRLLPVFLSEKEVRRFYQGFSNEIVWPLFHDLQTRCRFRPEYWETYQEVNRKFSRVLLKHTCPEDFIWIHDYHLVPLAGILHETKPAMKCSFFLHIPFPPPDIFMKLPWRAAFLKYLLEYAFLAFQTQRDRNNFEACLKTLFRDVEIERQGAISQIHLGERSLTAGAFPISIDYRGFRTLAASSDVRQDVLGMKASFTGKLMISVDRLDYTKGIPERLQAFEWALEKNPDLRGKVTLVQLVVPSRENVEAYRSLKEEIEILVSRINGTYTRQGWIPVVHLYQSWDRQRLSTLYRAADIALVTPLKDGMNLVAKEYCACQIDGKGVLILSEFAGAAVQLRAGALLVNPYDQQGIAEAIRLAVSMPEEERRIRMNRLRDQVRRQDLFWWVDRFMEQAAGKKLDSFPARELPPI
jgi:trehalose 6-phosphate synthase